MNRQQRFIQRKFRQELRRNLLAEEGPHAVQLVIDHMKPNFNIGKLFRTCDAFGVRGIHLVDIPFFDPCTARGALRHVPAHFHDDFAAAHRALADDGYTLYALDPEAPEPLAGTELVERAAMIVGHEEFGFSFDRAAYPDVHWRSIRQYGKVQSLNASIAGSLALYEWLRQRELA